MYTPNPSLVSALRTVSRALVREFGFLNQTVASTGLSASAVHAIVEIGLSRQISSKSLADILLLEKSTISRLLKSLHRKGLVREQPCPDDRRVKHLRLSKKGENTYEQINQFARTQVIAAIKPLTTRAREKALDGLEIYTSALAAGRHAAQDTGPGAALEIKTGYTSALIGSVVSMHAAYYSRTEGFQDIFECDVAGGMAEFVPRLGHANNNIWHASKNGRIVGCIAIDGQDLGENLAHLRWFLVEDGLRGTGLGRALLGKAVGFCDRNGFAETHLWTFKGLDAARRLYEAHGFKLVGQKPGDQWGKMILEQKFVRSALQNSREPL